MEEIVAKLINDMQREINLIGDRVLALERSVVNKMSNKKNCGKCSATGKIFYATMCDPPTGSCDVCYGKGYI